MAQYGTIGGSRVVAPSVTVQAMSPETKVSAPVVLGLLDTGASMTCIPLSILEALRPSLEYRNSAVAGVNGTKIMKIFRIDIRLNSCLFRGLEVVGFERDFALVGRDILNNYKIVFDGLNSEWRIEGHDNC